MIYVGTCSWTEKTLIQSGEFYPRNTKTAEDRLRYYADQFKAVEVDSSYYAIPSVYTTRLWAERTPEDFIFHMKAYGALTGHGIDPRTLPRDMQGFAHDKVGAKKYVYIKEPALLQEIAQRFREALYPLIQSGKLGLLVFQFPPWFHYRTENLDYLLECSLRMNDLPVAVEFRHGSWLTPDRAETVLRFLREHHLSYITADEPQYGTLATIPFVPHVTTDIAYFRFHGRNKENWLKKGIETSQRYAYQYTDDELKDFRRAVIALNANARRTFAMFNNCHIGFAVRNAARMKELIKEGTSEGQ